MQAVSAVIPNRDGADLLRQTLPPLLRELPAAEHEILVVDDASKDDSVAMLPTAFPDVRVIALNANVGFGAACNRGFEEASNDLVLLLNSDMEVGPGSIALLAQHFSDPGVFAAGPQYAAPGEELEPVDDGLGLVRPQLGSPAGGGLFSRAKFLELGGFDPLYHPFYWEDLDLGWNAWRHGWRIMLDGRACFVHRESATIRRLYSQRFVTRVRARNRCLFGWRNLRDKRLFLRFMGRSLGRAAKGLLVRGVGSELLGVLQSIPHVRRALASRATTLGPSDQVILDTSATPFSRLNAV